MGKMTAIAVMIGMLLFGTTVAASTYGWGVDRPQQEQQEDESSGSSHQSRRAYHGGHFFIFYRTTNMRHAVSSGIRGGGLRAGK